METFWYWLTEVLLEKWPLTQRGGATSVSDVYVDDMNFNLIALLLALVVDLLGIPVVAVASSSLYSKITRKETQGAYELCLLH